jgi:hypothetical protein
MTNELERTRKETVVVEVKFLSQHLPEGTEKNHDNLTQNKPVSWSRL